MHIKSKYLSETVVVFHELDIIVHYLISKNTSFFFFNISSFTYGMVGQRSITSLRSKSRHWNLMLGFSFYCLENLGKIDNQTSLTYVAGDTKLVLCDNLEG